MLQSAFKKTNQSLHDEATIDSTFSGTTVVVTLLSGKTIYVANAGDSRAMIGRSNPHNNQIQVLLLTR
jgi:serine/threonine protein phosphatase PrpC